MSTSTILANVLLTCPIYNASGCLCTESSELWDLETSGAGAILTKSSTVNARVGNALPRQYFKDETFSLNSMGLPNHGCTYYTNFYSSNSFSKPFIQSIYPFNSQELVEMFAHFNTLKITTPFIIELNVSCPNVNNELSIQKIHEFLQIIKDHNTNKLAIGLKLMPYYSSYEFDQVSAVLLEYVGNIDYITCINSVVNGMEIDVHHETCVIYPNGGLGGVGGFPCLSVGLANVYNFNKRLNKDVHRIDIVGCGGVKSGEDVFKYILAGANAVQVGTAFYVEGVGIFERLDKELYKIMSEKGYVSLEDFRGKLQVCEPSV